MKTLTARRLIVTLACVVAVGGLGAFAVSRLLEGVLRGKSKRFLGDMVAIGSALNAYQRAHGVYPVVTPRQPIVVLRQQLSPFLPVLPASDGWGHSFLVASSEHHYSIWSLGRDGLPGPNQSDGAFETWDGDVEYRDGAFVRYPKWLSSVTP